MSKTKQRKKTIWYTSIKRADTTELARKEKEKRTKRTTRGEAGG
jgi:hypothetical protein